MGDVSGAGVPGYDDSDWRVLDLPHDWSIEGEFSEEHPAGADGGALPAGVGWYRKTFVLPEDIKGKRVFIDFDGVQRNSGVWINGHFLGKRPNGYSSFRYELTPWLRSGSEANVIAVRVDNSAQPASRWYTGSGIYRNVRLVATGNVHVGHWGTFICTATPGPQGSARITLDVQLRNHRPDEDREIRVRTVLYDQAEHTVAVHEAAVKASGDSLPGIRQEFEVAEPELWSVESPKLYKAVTEVYADDQLSDRYETPFGIRYFEFDAEKGFSLNGQPMKILGVCMHHDLGALGAAVNTRAMERQLEILKAMGCNAIRTAHNPPAPELLDLCDRMGFIVVDEAFDMWRKKKKNEDYHKDWDEWHRADLRDLVKRDRNHPSVFVWSIGNEIREQFDSTGISMTRELAGLVKDLDPTRPVTCALTENIPEKNFIYRSGALDLLCFNYKHEAYPDFPELYPGEAVIASETASALASRGFYQMPSDSTFHWPAAYKEPFDGNPNLTVSAYDQVSAYWGTTHEESWKAVKQAPHIAGLFVWSGFDYLGEPVPYSWPARSSYYGIVDLAGFPKDAYYMYQSEWTDRPVLHVFPHWNWEPGQTVDIWAYYNQADEVELFLNGESLGARKKEEGGDLHVMWRVNYRPGTLKAVSRKNGKTVMTREIRTAGEPAKVGLEADRDTIRADGKDLSFIKVSILDAEGNLVPDADNRVRFSISGEGTIAGVDNGYQASMEPFKADQRKAYKGLCLAIVQSGEKAGKITLEASSEGLQGDSITIEAEP